MSSSLTLYGPRFSTMQVKTASRPTETVRLLSGVPNLGKSATRKVLVLSIPSRWTLYITVVYTLTYLLLLILITYPAWKRAKVCKVLERNSPRWMGRVNGKRVKRRLSQPLYISRAKSLLSWFQPELSFVRSSRVSKGTSRPACPMKIKGTKSRDRERLETSVF